MATAETTTAVVYREFDLQEFVQNATWRELLIELVQSSKLDPWDIDISKVVDEYLSAVKRMKVLELRIPANIILSASILLRMKSDTLSIFDIHEEVQIEEPQLPGPARPDVEQLVPRLRMQPRRKVTLEELLAALDSAMKIEVERSTEHEKMTAPIPIIVNTEDIDEKKQNVIKKIGKIADREGLTTFSALASGYDSAEKLLLDVFVPVLFLAHENQIVLIQENFFGEILIKISGDHSGKRGRPTRVIGAG
ncbi:MAG: segregation/condensation protein A [Candidatus Marsarchaeota archaeon]|jgi:segregation and condensation protein A|nr:segregation/condensation protein A [Candidatus Marsarchaeota archaeon]MCL5115062.1 segregation/condensation protein A [Candidatus Marsarchaeota archaeon]